MANNNGNGNRGNARRSAGERAYKAEPRVKYRKKRSRGFKFAVVLVSMVAVLLTLSTAAVLGYYYVTGSFNRPDGEEKDPDIISAKKDIGTGLVTDKGSITDLFTGIPERTNFIIMVIDYDGQSSRADAIVTGCYNSTSGELSLISIPRDTKVRIPEERRQILKDRGRSSPSGDTKINGVYNYAGKSLGVDFTVKQAEELLGISIQYYVLMDLEGFKYIVDALDGVEFDVPQRMIYNDPYQDLHIDLYPGKQVLNGEKAMQMLRYRQTDKGREKESPNYASADLKRVDVQKQFLAAALMQAMRKDKILQTAGAFLDLLINYVETNVPVTEALKYIDEVKKLSPDNIKTYTIHGEGGDYFTPDAAKNYDLVQEIFYKTAD